MYFEVSVYPVKVWRTHILQYSTLFCLTYTYVLKLKYFWAAEALSYLKKQFILKQSGLLRKID